eukprot:Rmarinus@m.8566
MEARASVVGVLSPLDPSKWVPDSECVACSSCEEPFSLFVRRHHCRICGWVFCHSCSTNELRFKGADPNEIVYGRTCDNCFQRLVDGEDILLPDGKVAGGSPISRTSSATNALFSSGNEALSPLKEEPGVPISPAEKILSSDLSGMPLQHLSLDDPVSVERDRNKATSPQTRPKSSTKKPRPASVQEKLDLTSIAIDELRSQIQDLALESLSMREKRAKTDSVDGFITSAAVDPSQNTQAKTLIPDSVQGLGTSDFFRINIRLFSGILFALGPFMLLASLGVESVALLVAVFVASATAAVQWMRKPLYALATRIHTDATNQARESYELELQRKKTVQMFTKMNFKGTTVSVTADSSPYILTAPLDDQISSINIPPGLTVKVFAENGTYDLFEGPRLIADLRHVPFRSMDDDSGAVPTRLKNGAYTLSWDRRIKAVDVIPNRLSGTGSEPTEWLSTAVTNVWGEISMLLSDTLHGLLLWYLQEYKPAWLHEMTFREFTMGDIPPKITSASSLTHCGPDFQIELNVEWEGNSKIILLTKVSGPRGIIPDVSLELSNVTCRAKVILFMSWHAKGVAQWAPNWMAVSFRERPDIDYTLKPIGLEVTRLPGIKNWLRELVNNSLSWMIFPERLELPFEQWWTDALEQDAGPLPERKGVLEVTVVSASINSVEPWVELHCNKVVHKTQPVRKTEGRHSWEEHAEFSVGMDAMEVLKILVYDRSRIGFHDCVACAAVDFSKLDSTTPIPLDVSLDMNRGKDKGSLRIIITYSKLVEDSRECSNHGHDVVMATPLLPLSDLPADSTPPKHAPVGTSVPDTDPAATPADKGDEEAVVPAIIVSGEDTSKDDVMPSLTERRIAAVMACEAAAGVAATRAGQMLVAEAAATAGARRLSRILDEDELSASGFSEERTPVTGHNDVDLAASTTTPVLAASGPNGLTPTAIPVLREATESISPGVSPPRPTSPGKDTSPIPRPPSIVIGDATCQPTSSPQLSALNLAPLDVGNRPPSPDVRKKDCEPNQAGSLAEAAAGEDVRLGSNVAEGRASHSIPRGPAEDAQSQPCVSMRRKRSGAQSLFGHVNIRLETISLTDDGSVIPIVDVRLSEATGAHQLSPAPMQLVCDCSKTTSRLLERRRSASPVITEALLPVSNLDTQRLFLDVRDLRRRDQKDRMGVLLERYLGTCAVSLSCLVPGVPRRFCVSLYDEPSWPGIPKTGGSLRKRVGDAVFVLTYCGGRRRSVDIGGEIPTKLQWLLGTKHE